MQGNNSIGLVMATHLEAQPFIGLMPMDEVERTPFRVFRGGDIVLIISGIGKTNAAVAASYLVLRYHAGVIFNAGAAGAAVQGIGVGDIFHINKVIEYDRPKIIGGGLRYLSPGVMEGHATEVLATQDVPVIDAGFREKVAAHAGLVDMEGAAVLHASRILGIDCFLFKIVSDTPEHQDDSDIVKNIKAVRNELYYYMSSRVFR